MAFAVSPAVYSAFWQDSFIFPNDPFAVQSTDAQSGWIKFLILTSDMTTVYFQDSVAYPFHYDFAVNEMPEFAGMTPSQFDGVTLHESGRQALLGAVILPPTINGFSVIDEYGIQFAATEAIDPILVRDAFQLVKSKVIAGSYSFYFPSFEQLESAQLNESFFNANGITIGSADRWAFDNTCYSFGWAVGTLKYFDGADIDDAYLSGTLGPSDVLLTDLVPSEIPYVSGVLSLSPATPNSHVAILAQTFGSPFAHLALADDAQDAQGLVGRRVALRAVPVGQKCALRLVDAEGLDPTLAAELLALKDPPDLDIDAVQTFGTYGSPTPGLNPQDIHHFGGKASNYGMLRRSIPGNSPVATAFSFDLWNDFLDQTVAGGGTLRQQIALLLAPFTSYPPSDVRALSEALGEIRSNIEAATFSPAQENAVIAVLQDPQYGFDPLMKLRFRSSTNVEDSEHFTGAGLYDSKSGCLADDLDGDAVGPGQCDPSENNEKGVFRAIRKVYASFYNDNAYLERLRHGIDENDVGMAMLAHHSFPDPLERANGVAILEQDAGGERHVYLVTQEGDESVTNPVGGAIPEEVDVEIDGEGAITPTIVVYSNLVQIGEAVMDFPQDYVDLTALLLLAADEYEQVAQQSAYTLEFEYKQVWPNGGALPAGGLAIKQIRSIPQPDATPITPFLINDPQTRCTFQGESFGAGSAYRNHRMKSRWTLETRDMWLTEANLQQGLIADSSFRYVEGCLTFERNGPPSGWPQPSYNFFGSTATTGWTLDELQNPRTYSLQIQGIPTSVTADETPLVFLDDMGWILLQANYATPAGPDGAVSDLVSLRQCAEDLEDGQLKQRVVSEPGVFAIATQYYWPPPPGGIVAGYTAPLVRFVQTTITGLTTDPIVLEGEFSQTYSPEHHNFTEHFVFEPALDPNVSQQQRDELATAGYRAFYMAADFGPGFYVFHGDASWGDTCLDCTDADGDGRCQETPMLDCNDSDPNLWSPPGEARDLRFATSDELNWSEPGEKGGATVLHDTIRSTGAGDFTAATCVESDGADTATSVSADPSAGTVDFYLVRAVNDCPAGDGSLGRTSLGVERVAAACP